MKKVISTMLAVLAIAATMVVCVSAGDGMPMNKSYEYNPVSGVDYTVYYDIGSILPYDDVRGRTRILLYSAQGESEGYANVEITTADGTFPSYPVRLPDAEGYVDSDWYEIGSTDQAISIKHQAHAKRNASIYRQYETINP